MPQTATARNLPRAAFEEGSFADLIEPRQWLAFQSRGRVHNYPRGSALLFEGESADSVVVLLEGRVKITRASPEGHEVVLSVRGPGEIVGELPCLDARQQLASVLALEPVRALVIDSRYFRQRVASTPSVASALFEVLSRRLSDAILKRAEFHATDTVGRISARLVELAERYGTASARGVVIGLPLSQEELGGWAGASHAGVAKALQVLRAVGWIETERRRIIVRDLAALRRRSRLG